MPEDPMKKKWFLMLPLFPLLFSMTLSAAQVTNATSKPGLNKGVVFKVPLETDEGKISYLAPRTDIQGGEILLMWGDIEKQEGVFDWSRVDKAVAAFKKEGKKSVITVLAAAFSINDTPAWVFNDYNVRRIAKGAWMNFEKPDADYEVLGTVVTDPALVLSGGKSLKGVASGGSKTVVRTNPSAYLDSVNGYSIQFDYRLLSDADYFVRVVRKLDGKSTEQRFEWSGRKGEKGSRTAEFTPDGSGAVWSVEFGIKSGSYVIDNLNIVEMRTAFFTGTLTFPNYFDPVFKEKYGAFVKAYAEKYGPDPDVDTIYVGGFGRWEEMTLCDDTDLFALEDQWQSYGYTDAAYLDHIYWCADIYKQYFGDKNLMMTIAGYPGADNWKDQNLLNWKVQNYVAEKGIALKYNGWQTKCTEWNSTSMQFAYAADRYRNDPNLWFILEEGAQVNGMLSEIMGHPVSMLNKAIALGSDYYWIYPSDLTDPYTARYLQYANEQAGTGLITSFYNILGRYVYDSPYMKKSYNLDDLVMELYHPNDAAGIKSEYGALDGVKFARTNPGNDSIVFSIDDCQKYSGMYGSVLTVDYLDQGTDTFDISILRSSGQELARTVTKTGSGLWKTVSLYDDTWTNSIKGGKSDNLRELWIQDNDDGVETVRQIEVHFVPARQWVEAPLSGIEPLDTESGTAKAKTISSDRISIVVPGDKVHGVSGIAIPVGEHPDSKYGYVNLRGTVTAEVDGNTVEVAKKDFYMPGKSNWFYFPLASVPDAASYTVTVYSDQGQGLWFTGKEDAPAFRVLSFATAEGSELAVKDGTFVAGYPFAGLAFDAGGLSGKTAAIEKRLPDGTWVVVDAAASVFDTGSVKSVAHFTPQTAGTYRIAAEGVSISSVTPLELDRIQPAKAPLRDLRGEPESGFSAAESTGLWKVVSGLSNATVQNGILSADVSAENPVLETAKPLSIVSDKSNMFHVILKNRTDSGFVKLYWKKEGSDYSETDSMLIPVVANDTEYREYSFHIGFERNWSGTISGLKLMPVTGHTDAGSLSIFTAEIRKGLKRNNVYLEALDVTALGSGTMVGTVLPVTTAPTQIPTPTTKPGGGGKAGDWLPILGLALVVVAAAAGSFLFGIGMAKRRRKD
jgi:hypothetical protein